MPNTDTIIAHGNRLNLQALDQALQNNNGAYVYADNRGKIRLSQQPLRGTFYGVSSKHRAGFEKLRRIVARRYGVELNPNVDATNDGVLHAQNLRNKITAAQNRNRQAYRNWFQDLQHKSGYDPHLSQFAQNEFRDQYRAGQVLTARQHETFNTKAANRFERLQFADKLATCYNDESVRQRYLNATRNDLDAGNSLTPADKRKWQAYAAGKAAAAGIAQTIRSQFANTSAFMGHVAQQKARATLDAKLNACLNDPTQIPSELLGDFPQLPKAWIEESILAAHGEVSQRIEHIRQDQIEDAGNANQAKKAASDRAQRAQAMASSYKETLLGTSKLAKETELILERSADEPATHNVHQLFSGKGSFADENIFQLCTAIDDLDSDAFMGRIAATHDDHDDHETIEANLTSAKQLAKLGLELQRDGVPADVAAIMIRMELAERAAGRHNQAQDGQWAPNIRNNLADMKQIATRFVQLQAQLQPADAATDSITHLIEAELSERAAGRGNGNQLSNGVRRLVNNNCDDLKYFLGHGVSPRKALEIAHQSLNIAAPDLNVAPPQLNLTRAEIVSCARLNMTPSVQMADVAWLQQHFGPSTAALTPWHQAGFNRVETLAYMYEFRNPQSISNPNGGRDFRGSNLTPAQIKMYARHRVPLNAKTRVGHFIPENSVQPASKIGQGTVNSVYLTAHRTPTGIQRRVFKPLQDAPRGLKAADIAKANIATAKLADQLGLGDTVVDCELGIENINGRPRLGISMQVAPGKTAGQWQYFQKMEVVPGSKYEELLKYKEEIRNDPQVARNYADYHNLREVYVDPDTNRLMITGNFYPLSKKDPTLQRQTAGLQIVEWLVEKKDGNYDNYMLGYDDKGNVNSVKGVDYDFSFGIGSIANSRISKLPPVIDREQERQILALDPQTIRNEMAGLLDDSQIDRLVERLAKLKAHVRSNDCLVIEPGGWGSDIVTSKLTKWNSLVGRDAKSRAFEPTTEGNLQLGGLL